MAEKQHPPASQPSESADPVTPRRSAGHRVDVRDVVAELAERAQLISQEAGTKVSAAMKDVVGAAAGIAGFAIESARDLVQYMVRRGQMTPEEGERLIREAEAAQEKRSAGDRGKATASKLASQRAAAVKAEAAARSAAAHAAPYARPVSKTPIAAQPSVPKASGGSSVAHKTAPPPSPPAKSAASKPAPTMKTKSAKPAKAAKPAKSSKPAKKRK
jgi:polyhydroxyalkanoate synthesis regulator phasin